MGALGIPGAIGAVLVLGLAVTAGVKPIDEGLEGFLIPETKPVEPLPPPPIEPRAAPETSPSVRPQPIPLPAPRPETRFTFENSADAPVGHLPDMTGTVLGSGLGLPDIAPPAPRPRFDPVPASPRGNPGGWITEADYRSSWINRELTGTAGFTLDLDAEGRVANCTITRSTGHRVLDEATCKLLTRRARFAPARDAAGKPAAGSFSSAVTWQIP
jgi:protein TonB